MAEIVSNIFLVLLREVNALPVPRSTKDEIIVRLEFLRKQSLCDYDRRKPIDELREAWVEADRLMKMWGLYKRYQPSKEIWDTILLLVQVGVFKPTPKKIEPPAKPVSRYESFEVPEMFQEMRTQCAGIQPYTLRASMRTTLEFLEQQARLPKDLRRQSEIQTEWKRAHESLKTRGVLSDFDKDPMKSRILEFLKG